MLKYVFDLLDASWSRGKLLNTVPELTVGLNALHTLKIDVESIIIIDEFRACIKQYLA